MLTARFGIYPTPAGRRQFVAETSRWERFVRAISGVLRRAESEEGR